MVLHDLRHDPALAMFLGAHTRVGLRGSHLLFALQFVVARQPFGFDDSRLDRFPNSAVRFVGMQTIAKPT
mgnify:CR=1 FL=1